MNELGSRISSMIRADGPVSFERYMELALYDADLGFFTKGDDARGPGRDFVTSPQMSPLFGRLLVRHASGVWTRLGSPDRFDVIDAGGGRGKLAHDFMEAARREPWFDALEYRLVDAVATSLPSGSLPAGVKVSGDICELERPVSGLIIANELLDNLPGRLFRRAGSEWYELLVDTGAEAFEFVQSDTAAPAGPLAPAGSRSPEGTVAARSTRAEGWIADAAQALKAGELLVIDYAHPAAGAPFGGVRAFSEHQVTTELLADPGECDITFPVNWDAIRAAAAASGLELDPLLTQTEFLESLGIEDEIAPSTGRIAMASGKTTEALRLKDRRMRGLALIDPDGLGAFTVMRAGRYPK